MQNEPPKRDLTAADFDGHLERPLLSLTPEERLDWIWAGMQLLWAGKQARAARSKAPPAS